MITKKKLVLAYSGGLDTSFCAKYLSNKNYEVHSILVNTGGFDENELETIAKRAKNLGVASHINKSVEEKYYHKCIKYLIFGNILKNGTYPLSVSSERTIQATEVIKYALKIGASNVAHGSTGAGNDQVRFDMIFKALAPQIEIITPIRDLRLSRDEEIAYLKKHGVDLDFKKMAYSVNKGLWGTSIGGKETLTSQRPLPEEAYTNQLIKNGTEQLVLGFERGELTSINGQNFENAIEAIRKVEAIASGYAIGRDIHIGDTIIGIKGRVGFEAAAPLIIIKAHQTLEKHVLSKWQMYWKDQLSNWYGMLLHEAQYYEPVMRDIEKFLDSSQKHVTGKVFVRLNPYRYFIEGIDSQYDLMCSDFGEYGEANKKWTSDDMKGFIQILGIPSGIYNHVSNKVEKLVEPSK